MMAGGDVQSDWDKASLANAGKSSPLRIRDVDFLIIGAAKSATTWLQESLLTDPAICMPLGEFHYFSSEYELGENWYLRQFPRTEAHEFFGERSNSYLEHPAAAGRIHSTLPHAKLIAQLRNPVERAYSDYCMLYRRGEVGGDIDRYLDPRKAAEARFLQGGLYYRQLQRYFDLYPRDQLLVLLYDQVESAPAAQLARVQAFLGLNQVAAPVETRVKDKRTPVLSPRVRRYLSPVKSFVQPLRGTAVFDIIYRTIAWKPAYPAMNEDLRKRLGAFYEKESDFLGELLSLDLSTWVGDVREGVRKD
jgi:hypothetical protein